MSRGVYTLGGLLIVALVLSYISWTHEASAPSAGGVRLADISSDSFEALRWKTPESTVEIEAQSDAHGRWLRVTVESPGRNGEAAEAAAEDGAGEDSEEAEQEPGGEEGEDSPGSNGRDGGAGSGDRIIFTGGPQARRAVDAVSPLFATRRVEGVTDERLEAMGFVGPERTLELVERGTSHLFELGGRSYGGGFQYLRRPGERAVYLVEAGPLRPLEHGARRLMQRELIGTRRNDIERLKVQSAEGGELTIVHQRRGSEPGRSFFADSAEPDRPMGQYDNWIGKVLALRAVDYPREEELSGELELVVRLAFQAAGSSRPALVDIFREVGAKHEERWYARSDHARALVSLPGAATSEVIADLGAVMGD